MSEPERRISPEDVRHVARLARLALDDDEIGRYALQLSAIFEHVDAVRRLDSVAPSLDRATVLAQAPLAEGDCFQVPRIMGEAP